MLADNACVNRREIQQQCKWFREKLGKSGNTPEMAQAASYMIDPGEKVGQGGTGTIRRLGEPKALGAKALGRPIVFELTDTDGATLAAISMPMETIEELLRPHLSNFPQLQLDDAVWLDSEFFALFPPGLEPGTRRL